MICTVKNLNVYIALKEVFLCMAVIFLSVLLLISLFLILHAAFPCQRYLLSEAEEHHQLFDLIESMLEYEPTKRLALGDSLKHPFFENGGIGEAAGSKNWEVNRDISR